MAIPYRQAEVIVADQAGQPHLRFRRATARPLLWAPNTVYFVGAHGSELLEEYVVDANGTPTRVGMPLLVQPAVPPLNLAVATNEDLWQVLAIVGANNEPVPLTGTTVKMEIRHASTNALMLSCTTVNGRLVVTSELGGTVEVRITNPDVLTIPIGVYVYDFILTSGLRTRRLFWGTFTVTLGITQ